MTDPIHREEDDLPENEEILAQLKLILLSSKFKKSVIHRRLLDLIVRSNISGRKLSEEKIGKKLFPTKYEKDLSDIVRVNISQLRSRLQKYYEDEGNEDSIIIEIDTGEGYRVSCSRFNANCPAIRQLLRARRMLEPRTPPLLVQALIAIQEALATKPDNVYILTTAAEIHNRLCYLRPYKKFSFHEHLELARQYSFEAITLKPRLWHAQITHATALMSCGDFKGAGVHFKEAIKIDGSRTHQCAWYNAYLLATGEIDEAMNNLEKRRNQNREDAFSAALYALGIWLSAREIGQFAVPASHATSINWSYWFCIFIRLLGEIHYAVAKDGDVSYALGLFESLQRAVNPYPDDGIQFIPELQCLALIPHYRFLQIAVPDEICNSYLNRASNNLLSESWFERSLEAISVKNQEDTLVCLHNALQEGDPRMWWVHLYRETRWLFRTGAKDFQVLLRYIRKISKRTNDLTANFRPNLP